MEKIFTSRLHKSGTSVVCVIPAQILGALNLVRGDTLVLRTYDNHTLIVRKFDPEESQAQLLQDLRF